MSTFLYKRLALTALGLVLLALASPMCAQEMKRSYVDPTKRANSVTLNMASGSCQVVTGGELSIRDIVPAAHPDESPQELSLGEIARRIRAERSRREPMSSPWPAQSPTLSPEEWRIGQPSGNSSTGRVDPR